MGWSLGALAEFVIQTILVFGASYVIGMFIRGQMLEGSHMKMLIFFAVVALAGGLLGAHAVPGLIAKHNLVK